MVHKGIAGVRELMKNNLPLTPRSDRQQLAVAERHDLIHLNGSLATRAKVTVGDRMGVSSDARKLRKV